MIKIFGQINFVNSLGILIGVCFGIEIIMGRQITSIDIVNIFLLINLVKILIIFAELKYSTIFSRELKKSINIKNMSKINGIQSNISEKISNSIESNSVLFITGNKHKAREAQEISIDKLGKSSGIFKIILSDTIEGFEEIPEIQDLDVDIVSKDKVVRMYEQLERLIELGKFSIGSTKLIVVCEDTGLYLEGGYMHNFPGAFFKQFCDTVGYDMCKIHKNGKAIAKTSVSFYDGTCLKTFIGSTVGKIIECPSEGSYGFGFDSCFIPEDHKLTFSQMKPEQKNSISMRKIAWEKFFDWYLNFYIGK